MARNADKLGYPVKECICSALPLVDEFVIALDQGDKDDRTLEVIASIASPKIKIVETKWDTEKFSQGTVHAQQTDLAKRHCSGDWLLYLQCDELLHEEDYDIIKSALKAYSENVEIDGFIFQYLHFWGDYGHLVNSHSWYKKEVRIIRNDPDIHSWQSAQSFRRIPNFDGLSFRQKRGTQKLNVIELNARIFHYGWVRPPEIMLKKMQALDRIHGHATERFSSAFDYGDLSKLDKFYGSHPAVMQDRIAKQHWTNDIGKTAVLKRRKFKHERFKYKLLTYIERKLNNGEAIFSFRNYKLKGKFSN